MSEISNNSVLKTCVRKSLTDSCSAKEGTALDVYFELLGL